MHLARSSFNRNSLVYLFFTVLTSSLRLTSASPIPYSDYKLAEIDHLRASGASEADIAHQYPLLHSPLNSNSPPHSAPFTSLFSTSSSASPLFDVFDHPTSSSASSSSAPFTPHPHDDFWDVVFTWLGFRAPATPSSTSAAGAIRLVRFGRGDGYGTETGNGNGGFAAGKRGGKGSGAYGKGKELE
ncbi:hypothetical protein MMC07_009473, partial [Pseudocyphellaria aurata]|nr:hypothetical protein [Pseudocyphellaria aurata]